MRLRYNRHQVSFAVIIFLVVFLLGSLFHELKSRDVTIARLTESNQTVIFKLSDIFVHTLAAEAAAQQAGQVPTVRVEDVIAQIKGVDQRIIDEALQKAYRDIAAQAKVTASSTSTTRPASTATTATTRATSTTTTARATTTTTTVRPSTTTTVPPPTTTTTRPKPCTLLRVPLLGLCL